MNKKKKEQISHLKTSYLYYRHPTQHLSRITLFVKREGGFVTCIVFLEIEFSQSMLFVLNKRVQ